MVVYLVAVSAALFYAVNVPVRVAFTLRLGQQNALKFGVGVFEARWIVEKQFPLSGDGMHRMFPNFSRLHLLRAGRRAFKRFWRNARFEGARFSLKLGTGDAARTAVLCGAAGMVLAALHAKGRVTPDFERPQLALSAGGIVYVRAGHIMYAALSFARELAKERFNHGQASD